MSFPRYEKYKDSGVEWLGDVPEHWQVHPARFVVKHIDNKNENAECQDYLSLMANIGVIPYAEKGDIGNKKPEDLSKCKLVEVGDIVINSMNYSIGSYGISPYKGVCSPVYVVLRAKEEIAFRRFAFRIFQNTAFQRYAASFGNGILAHRAAIGWDDIKVIDIALPSLKEQEKILTFLDEETAKIDALVEEQRRLIELLKEKRQAVISHAVTKGLKPDISMKDSGIEWIGNVPNSWQIKRLRMVATVRGGVAKGRDLGESETITVPYLRVANVQDGYLDLNEITTIEITATELERYRLRPGDVLMNEGGDFDKLGRGHIWRGEIEDCIHQNHVFSVRPKEIEPEWLTLISTADCGRFYFMIRSKQSTNLASISSSNLGELPVPLPPPSERKEILERVDDITSELNTLIRDAISATALLQERRSALISAAVTGKIDVRSYTAKEAA